MKNSIPNAVKSAAAVMAADILLLVGFVFLLLGVAKFLNEYIGIQGSGEGAVGITLLIIALIILARSKMSVRFRTMQAGQPPPEMPPKDAPSDSYR